MPDDTIPPVGNAVSTVGHRQEVADPITDMLMRAASDPNFDPAKFEVAVKFLVDREAKAAHRAYNFAMGKALADMAAVDKDGENKHLRVRYATLDAMLKVVLPAIAPYGLHVRWGTMPASLPGWQCVTCIISHDDGHSEIVAMEGPIMETTGVRGGQTQMNDLQAIGSTASYLKRYTLGMAFTLLLSDEQDDDGEAHRRTQPRGGSPAATPPKDVKPDTARVAAKYPKIFAQVQRVPSLEALDNFKSHPKFTAWWDAEAKIARTNGNMIDDMIYARRLELEAVAKGEREVAEARARAAAAAAKTTSEPVSQDLELDMEEGQQTVVGRMMDNYDRGKPADPVNDEDPAAPLIARLRSCETTVALDSCLQAPEFTRELVQLASADADRVTAAAKARAAELQP